MAKKLFGRFTSSFSTSRIEKGREEEKQNITEKKEAKKTSQSNNESFLGVSIERNSSFKSQGAFTFSEREIIGENLNASFARSTRPFTNVFSPTKRTDLSGRKARRRLTGTSSAPYATWIKGDETPELYEVGQSIDTERFKCLESLDPETRRNLMIDIVRPLSIYEALLYKNR